MRAARIRAVGFTLIELMVVIAVVATLALLAAPSFQDMILMQRLRGINAQVVTDLQFARNEAAARSQIVRINFGSDSAQTCYAIYTSGGNSTRCNCLLGAGAACASGTEIRTVSVPRNNAVQLSWTIPLPGGVLDSAFGYDPVTGGLVSIPSDQASQPLGSAIVEARIDDERRLRTTVLQSGRPTVCAPNAAKMQVTACP